MLSNLQKINVGKIVLVKIGIFYIAKGKDAVLLNKIINLKPTCLEKEICKVGFPVRALNKYIGKLKELGYGYIAYDYDSKENKLTQIMRNEGKANKEEEERVNCLMCKNNINYYKKEDKYMEALREFYKERRGRIK